jgi:hypothetical protein
LLKTSPDVEVLPELSPESVPSLFGLIEELRGTLHWQKWKEFSEGDIEARVIEVLRQVWRSGRQLHFRNLDRPRFGLKQPWSENLWQEFHDTLGSFRPQWVYALRDPAQVYRSNLQMAGAPDWTPEEFRHLYMTSLDNALTLAEVGDLFVFDMDACTTDEEHRRQTVGALFTFLGIAAGPWASWFSHRWTKVNASSSENRGPRADSEVEARVSALLEPESFGLVTARVAQLRAVGKRQASSARTPLPAAVPLPKVADDAAWSTRFWNERYAEGGTSSPQPFGSRARFKAEILTRLLDTHNVGSVVEFGVGDGLQLSQIEYPRYIGYDVSPVAIQYCEWLFEGDPARQFRVCQADEVIGERVDLAVSLNVIPHLIEDATFDRYMRNLFGCATKLVAIFSTDEDLSPGQPGERHRNFTAWVEREASMWRLAERIPFPDEVGDEAAAFQFFVYVR